ncbi:kinesin-like protein kif11 [Anaeramoeba flamelloides]|uniref:Kinesin-like protein kif11 n=1 Tax=Anaeramoeba flamelloides TaxID=1746091 RepID=A0ABQ8Y0M2_9EUKA|nr:kinesin-like protein kif11 [Anaeramoeba flamelloides]
MSLKESNLYDTFDETEKPVNIKVVVRIRPQSPTEKLLKIPIQVSNSNKNVYLKCSRQNERTYSYDRVFDQKANQKELFDQVMKPMIQDVLNGYNATIFAYGQTGSGKTYTMEGPGKKTKQKGEKQQSNEWWYQEETAGLIPRATKTILQNLKRDGIEFNIKVTLLEIYNEELIDLLAGTNKESAYKLKSNTTSTNNSKPVIQLFEDQKNGGTIIKGLEQITVRTLKDIEKVLFEAFNKRITAKTKLNHHSSRSHTIFTLLVTTKQSQENGQDIIRTGKLNLVDLAGSENIKKSGSKNQQQYEAGKINQSLLTLGRVISSLIVKQKHIPYRESKLTRILQDSLGGKTKTCIIATISPSGTCIEETRNTLEYARNAQKIKNKPSANTKLTKNKLIEKLKKENKNLKKEISLIRHQNGVNKVIEQLELEKQELQIDLEEHRDFLFERKERIKELVKKKDDLEQNAQDLNKINAQQQKQILEFHSTIDQLNGFLKEVGSNTNQLLNENGRFETKINSFSALTQNNDKLLQNKTKLIKDDLDLFKTQLNNSNANLKSTLANVNNQFNFLIGQENSNKDGGLNLLNDSIDNLKNYLLDFNNNFFNSLDNKIKEIMYKNINMNKSGGNTSKNKKNSDQDIENYEDIEKKYFAEIKKFFNEYNNKMNNKLNKISHQQNIINNQLNNIYTQTIQKLTQLTNKFSNNYQLFLQLYNQKINDFQSELKNDNPILIERINNMQHTFEKQAQEDKKELLNTFASMFEEISNKRTNNLKSQFKEIIGNIEKQQSKVNKFSENIKQNVNKKMNIEEFQKTFTQQTANFNSDLKKFNKDLETKNSANNEKLKKKFNQFSKMQNETMDNYSLIVKQNNGERRKNINQFLSHSKSTSNQLERGINEKQKQIQSKMENISQNIKKSQNILSNEKTNSQDQFKKHFVYIDKIKQKIHSLTPLQQYQPTGNTPIKSTLKPLQISDLLRITPMPPILSVQSRQTMPSSSSPPPKSPPTTEHNLSTQKFPIFTTNEKKKTKRKKKKLLNKKKIPNSNLRSVSKLNLQKNLNTKDLVLKYTKSTTKRIPLTSKLNQKTKSRKRVIGKPVKFKLNLNESRKRNIHYSNGTCSACEPLVNLNNIKKKPRKFTKIRRKKIIK